MEFTGKLIKFLSLHLHKKAINSSPKEISQINQSNKTNDQYNKKEKYITSSPCGCFWNQLMFVIYSHTQQNTIRNKTNK